jgi:hypothetical protein
MAFFPQYFWNTDFSLPGDLGAAPKIEYIAENILATINAITVENGFNQTLVAMRPKRNDWRDVIPEDNKVLIVQEAEEIILTQVGQQRRQHAFIIEALVIDSDAATDSIDTRRNKVRCDIEKKLKEDYKRGGYALDTDIESSTMFDTGEGFSGVAIRVIVECELPYGNPYSLS